MKKQPSTEDIAKTQSAIAAAGYSRAGRRRRNATTKKVAEVADQPFKSKSAFNLRRRMPGWRPDKVDKANTEEEECYFQEEALGLATVTQVGQSTNATHKVILKHFEPPHGKKGVPSTAFHEPTTPDDWKTFNQWILGYPINGSTMFEAYLTAVAGCARIYNAALYWLRRLHFHENAPAGSDAPPFNPRGDRKKKLPSLSKFKGKEEFTKLVREAEADWERAVYVLDHCFDDNDYFSDISADMVEINGYIVSMRIVCNDTKRGTVDEQPRR